MPANASSRKSFTATRLRSAEYRRLRYRTCTRGKIRGCTIIRTRGRHLPAHAHEGADSRRGYTLAECLASIGIDLAYPIDMSALSLSLSLSLALSRACRRHSRSLVIRNFTSCFKTHDAAIPRPTMRAPLAHPFFPPSLFAGLESCAKPGIAARSPRRTRERRHNRRECQAIFSSRCSAIRYISLRRRLNAP